MCFRIFCSDFLFFAYKWKKECWCRRDSQEGLSVHKKEKDRENGAEAIHKRELPGICVHHERNRGT